MPLIDVKLYEGRLNPDSQAALIARLTDAVAEVLGDQVRDQTWVVLQEIPAARWGIAGRPGTPPLPGR